MWETLGHRFPARGVFRPCMNQWDFTGVGGTSEMVHDFAAKGVAGAPDLDRDPT